MYFIPFPFHKLIVLAVCLSEPQRGLGMHNLFY